MKRLFIITALVIGIFGFTSVVKTPLVAAQTKQEARNCFNTYDGLGTGRGTNNDLTPKLLGEYNAGKCPTSKGGNCVYGGGSSLEKIDCDDPDYVAPTGTTEDSASEDSTGIVDDSRIETIKDPALEDKGVCNASQCDIIARYVNPLIELLTVLVGIAIAIGIIFGGIQVATSGGDPQKAASGKDHIRNAIIGLIAYLLLFGGLQWLLPGGLL